MRDLDVVTIGRSSIDLYGAELGVELADVSNFVKSVGGSPTNIAVGASRLGLRSALVTRVGDEQMGASVLETLEQEGVYTGAIKRDPDNLTALVLLAVKDRAHAPHIFYRRECADMNLSADDIDPELIKRTKAIVVTGTHFSTDRVAGASWRAMRLAREAGAKIVLDIDFRPSLWGLVKDAKGAERLGFEPRIAQIYEEVIAMCDVVVGTEEEFCSALNVPDIDDALVKAHALTRGVLVCKRGQAGCDVYEGVDEWRLGTPVSGMTFNVDVVNTIGAGDAFMAGFLSGYLRGESMELCATRANACGAIAVSRLLCSQDYATASELEQFLSLARKSKGAVLRPSVPRRIQARKKLDGNLFLLACDHRTQFRDIAAQLGKDESRFSQFKRLAVSAAAAEASAKWNAGVIIDAEYGTDALYDAGNAGLWTARPIEVAGSRPVEFNTGPDIGSKLLMWPRSQTIKCLIHYDVHDPDTVRVHQEESLVRLADACNALGRELLLEIIPPKQREDRGAAVAEAVERVYEMGVKPDWWKLEPLTDADDWKRVAGLVDVHDDDCHGIVMLGQTASVSALQEAMSAASGIDRIRGFAIGRGIVAKPFEAWLKEEIGDDEAVSMMRQSYRLFIDSWMPAQTV
ncbi:5-dehydro-2-deoxygluconokinase [Hoeflea prorocentri]|uniref:5-dehydro-2-deoxygluconokinase n=1 Tax=Hoeflea prorocentri TaxID=1922333 RepID=A0A9X3ZGH4_9HYPH|nr:5-dehydro-2-deoxygluconokinase [Hoeflea prorocentri]MCY6379740.1 5-dehydro-2-deoxygluconokinase [Hoeflea prorocentri]MDA5397540.1 5-dehydro-2-deoxygluconokinase [Hoeflea prorocentri]